MSRDLKIDELRTLVAVAEAGTLANAATIIGRSVSAVSLQLKRLEESVGADLFVRDGRRLRLTLAGVKVLESGRRLIALQHDLRVLAKDTEEGRVAAEPDAASASRSDVWDRFSFNEYGPFTPAMADRPLRVNVSDHGEFRGMQPISGFRETLPTLFLGTMYDYYMQSAEKSAPIQYEAVEAIAKRCAESYLVVELSRQGPEFRVEAASSNILATNASQRWHGKTLSSCLEDRAVRSRSQLFSLSLSEQTTLYFAGPGALQELATYHVRVVVFPTRRGVGTNPDSILAVCDVNKSERYIVPSGAELLLGIPEIVLLAPTRMAALPRLIHGSLADVSQSAAS